MVIWVSAIILIFEYGMVSIFSTHNLIFLKHVFFFMYVLRSTRNHIPNICIGVHIIVGLELGTPTLLMEL